MEKIISFMKKNRNGVLFLFDIIIYVAAFLFSYFLVNENLHFDDILINTIVMSIILYELIMIIFGVYKNIIRYENEKDYFCYILIVLATLCEVMLLKWSTLITLSNYNIILIAFLIIVVTLVSYRVVIRMFLTKSYIKFIVNNQGKRTLIVGAGEASQIIISTISSRANGEYNIVGLVDDNIFKKDLSISGKKVLGTTHDIINICEKLDIDVILFTISNIDKKNKRRILEECNKTNCKIKVLLGTMDMLNKDIMNSFKNFTIEDVLEREPIELENSDLPQFISGETVLITGGGGSIGSELCRQVLSFYPKEIIIFDVYENNLYDIEQELKRNYPKSLVRAIVGSVRDIDSIESVFKKYSPTLVFHAAAHKHVPLMETRPLEAIKNNVFGTYNTALLSDKYNVKKFTLISTDKAVNPTNIMGATKRLCEMVIQAINIDSKTEYAAVRFGNVLGSNGSVIPLFKKQIANGGPITLTHKDIIRYFMTIPEAVSLVLCAATYAEGGELFVLDMGKPVKIYDLAVNLIKLSGLEPGVDIIIEETGLRPGEKLYEELLMDEENLKNTEHDKIFITKQKPITIKQLEVKLNKLKTLDYDIDKIKKVMKDIVPTYKEEGK